ncbi:MAG TPA: hypothetical protein VNP94_01540, partial [Actinomycetota bacterium]|nr:hypothetical protein [Actinomycetota bacterium]
MAMWEALVERWRRWEAARAGRADGRRGIPASDDPHPPFALRGIVARAEDALWRVARAWAEEDGALRERAEALRAELAQAEARREEARERLAAARRERKEADAADDRELARLAEVRRELDARAAAEAISAEAPPAGVPAGGPAVEVPSADVRPAEGPADAPGPGPEPTPSLPRIAGGAEDTATTSAVPTPDAVATARAGFPAWAYRLALAMIVAGEFPLNAV